MKKLKKILVNRVPWIVIAIALQFGFFAWLILKASAKPGFALFFPILSAVMIFIVMFNGEQRPSYKLIWLFMIGIAPLFGGVLYLFFGDKKFSKRRRRLLAASMKNTVGEVLESEEARRSLEKANPLLARQSNLLRNLSRYGVWAHTSAKYFAHGEDFLADALVELKKAEKFIFIEYFILARGKCWDSVLEVLKEKVKEGVDVRVMYDDLGSAAVLPINYAHELRKFGIKAVAFNPVMLHVNPRLNFRDHRKIMDIDGNVCYTGGLNLADEYINDDIRFGYWKDNAVKIEGDAVWNLTVMFLENWAFMTRDFPSDFSVFRPTVHPESDGFVQPFSDSPLDYKNVAESGYMEIINHAKKYIWITTPYLILDDDMTQTLIRVALCGVDVRIITPSVPDKYLVHEATRSNYVKLVEAGAKIYEFTPGFIHSKTFVADDEVAFVGTANLDYRSLYLHFELSVAFYNSTIVEEVKEDFLDAMGYSQLQEPDKIRNISFHRRIERKILQLFAPAL
jgi:Phosphatidylserine/phosphatidylglycerophosphate/cardiolipin synthases and related enzymes